MMGATIPPIPAAVEAEQALLGSLLLEPERLGEIDLKACEFYLEKHAWIFEAMQKLSGAGLAVDIISLRDCLERDEHLERFRGADLTRLEQIGGSAYLTSLLNGVPSAANFQSYARLVRDKYLRRNLLGISETLSGIAFDGKGPDAGEKLERAEKLLSELRKARLGPSKPAAPRGTTAAELLASDLPPLRWLVQDLIIRPGLTLLGGAPKVGKSWLGLQIARAVALGEPVLSRGVLETGPVLYFALEDGPARLQARIKAASWNGIERVCFLFGDALPPLDGKGLETLESDIVAHHPTLVVIDSLAAAKSGRVDENDAGQIAELMYALSRLSAGYDLALLVVHHHRKMTTGSPLADLRGSGALGGAADAILALYRERGVPESKLALDSRDAEGGDWTLGFTGCGWAMLGGGEIAEQKQAERRVSKALQSLGADGGTLEDVISAVGGIRRQDALNALDSLVRQGAVTFRDIAQDGKGRPRRFWYFVG